MNNQILLRHPADQGASYAKDTMMFLQGLKDHFKLPVEMEVEIAPLQRSALEVRLSTGSIVAADITHRTWYVFREGNMEYLHLIQGDSQDDQAFFAALAIAEEHRQPLHWIHGNEVKEEGEKWKSYQLHAQQKGVLLVPVSARKAGRMMLQDPCQMPVLLASKEVGEILTGLIGDALGDFGVFTEERQEAEYLTITVISDGKKGYLIPVQIGEILVRHLGQLEAAEAIRNTGKRIMNWLVPPGASGDHWDLPLDDRWGLLLTTALTDGEAFAPRRRRIDESFSTII